MDLNSLPEIKLDGYEVVVNFDISDFKNNATFYTDSNGLEMQKRILNYRPTWNIGYNYNLSLENITANYYPVNSAIKIEDVGQNKTFAVLNDRSQGGTSLKDGQIQLM